jgi:hypothetical protein
MTLQAEEFIRRFLIHTLPDGFMRIRHFGFLANRDRAKKLALCRDLLAVAGPVSSETPPVQDWKSQYEADGRILGPVPCLSARKDAARRNHLPGHGTVVQD